MIGQKLAHYEVLELLGQGGMGEVYRARDTKLDRDVALKLLHAEVARDPERLARFGREFQVDPRVGAVQTDRPNLVARVTPKGERHPASVR